MVIGREDASASKSLDKCFSASSPQQLLVDAAPAQRERADPWDAQDPSEIKEEDVGVLPYIKRFAGASAGALVAALLAAGLSAEQLAACDEFVYIPQYSNATASLNVNAACALVLAHFAAWAGFAETRRGGEGGLGEDGG